MTNVSLGFTRASMFLYVLLPLLLLPLSCFFTSAFAGILIVICYLLLMPLPICFDFNPAYSPTAHIPFVSSRVFTYVRLEVCRLKHQKPTANKNTMSLREAVCICVHKVVAFEKAIYQSTTCNAHKIVRLYVRTRHDWLGGRAGLSPWGFRQQKLCTWRDGNCLWVRINELRQVRACEVVVKVFATTTTTILSLHSFYALHEREKDLKVFVHTGGSTKIAKKYIKIIFRGDMSGFRQVLFLILFIFYV